MLIEESKLAIIILIFNPVVTYLQNGYIIDRFIEHTILFLLNKHGIESRNVMSSTQFWKEWKNGW